MPDRYDGRRPHQYARHVDLGPGAYYTPEQLQDVVAEMLPVLNGQYPSVQPSMLLNAAALVLPSDATLTRNSPAAYRDQANVLRLAPANTMRFDWYGGEPHYYIEEARVNKLVARNANPTDMSGVVPTSTSDGLVPSIVNNLPLLTKHGLHGVCTLGNHYRLNASAATARNFVNLAGTTGNTNRHALSAYVWGTGTVTMRVNTTNGEGITVSLTATPTRVAVPVTPVSATSATFQFMLEPGATLDFILPQMEEGPDATSPIISDALNTASRGSDLLILPADAGWLRQGVGTIQVHGAVSAGAGREPMLWNLYPNGIGGRRYGANVGATRQLRTFAEGGGTTPVALSPSTVGTDESMCFVSAWDDTGLASALRGSIGTQVPNDTGTLNRLRVGSSITGGVTTWVNGRIRRLAYYPARLPDVELQYLSMTR